MDYEGFERFLAVKRKSCLFFQNGRGGWMGVWECEFDEEFASTTQINNAWSNISTPRPYLHEPTHFIPPPCSKPSELLFKPKDVPSGNSLSLKGKVTFSSITGVSEVFGAQLTFFDNSASWW